MSKIGMWSPAANDDQLHLASQAYDRVATAALAAGNTGTAGIRQITGSDQHGATVTAVDTNWKAFDAATLAGIPATAQAATHVAAALTQYATESADHRRKVINLAIEAGALIVVGGALTLFSFGTSAGLAVARIAILLAQALTLAAGLSGAVATIVATSLTAAAFGAVEGFLSSIIAQAGKAVLADGNGISLTETMTWTGIGAASGAIIAPSPPVPAPASAPAGQHDATTMMPSPTGSRQPAQRSHVASIISLSSIPAAPRQIASTVQSGPTLHSQESLSNRPHTAGPNPGEEWPVVTRPT